MPNNDLISVGEISGVFGVKGWVKVFSFTQPRENILTYLVWRLQNGTESKEVELVQGRRQGQSIVAELKGISDRDQAALLIGWRILIDRQQLPEIKQDEYYWVDLIGLDVRTEKGVALGIVDHVFATGANDVLVVRDGGTERLIPFLQQQTVLTVDLQKGSMVVDWDPDF